MKFLIIINMININMKLYQSTQHLAPGLHSHWSISTRARYKTTATHIHLLLTLFKFIIYGASSSPFTFSSESYAYCN